MRRHRNPRQTGRQIRKLIGQHAHGCNLGLKVHRIDFVESVGRGVVVVEIMPGIGQGGENRHAGGLQRRDVGPQFVFSILECGRAERCEGIDHGSG